MNDTVVSELRHCGSTLAHRGCLQCGPVSGTIAFCAASQAQFLNCPYADPFQRAQYLPRRIMLPQRPSVPPSDD